MIASLTGTLRTIKSDSVIIDVGGIGFQVFLSTRTIASLPPIDSSISLLTYMQSTDAGIALFGFETEREKALFESLIGVPGIGPKGALAALSANGVTEIVHAITTEDTAALQRIPGIGKKTASRIIVELKSSIGDALAEWPELFGDDLQPAPMTGADVASASETSALEALRSMGFTDAEVSLALKGAPPDADEVALIQYALKRLGGR